ncbi:MAG: SRPBCC family protein [Cryobacterium sp.]|nr:SRPBCC family protein [Oligoflexia bacterium]
METTKTNHHLRKKHESIKINSSNYEREENQFAITIKKSPTEIYSFFRDFTNLPRFMKDLKEVNILSPLRSKWTVNLSLGPTVSWDAEIIHDIPGESIGWKSLDDSEVKTKGKIRFLSAPAGKGSIVLLSMDYSVPGGKPVEWLTKLKGEDPHTLVLTNLKRLKALLETGEIPTTEGQSSGREPVELH